MSLTTVNVYNLTSAQSDFTISFEFQKQSYVSVKVEDEALLDVSSNYSGAFTDATTYQFQDSNGDPEQIPSGYRVTFTRDTDISDDLFTFAAGTVIRPDALGESLKTLRDYTEEKNDQTANVTINIANDAVTTATQTSTTKASEASASATAAAGSASAASTSATNAATSETNAATSAANASSSETSAATSATNAATSATNAGVSQADAAISAASSLTNANNASTSAGNASTSEINAAASETAAEAARDTVLDVILGQFADDAAVDTYLSGVSYTKDAGDLYFNTTDSRMKVYTGSAWVDVANTTSSDAAATSATAAQAAQSAAETALSTFVNRYLGSYTNVASNDAEVTTAKSSVIDAGDIYFDSTNTVLRYFDGSSWHPAAATQVLNTTNLGNVGDVDYTSTPQSGDYLYRNASNQWERRAVSDVKGDLNLPTDAATDISTNATNIATNTTNIANNTSDIATNTTNIANNTSDIATNTTAIASNDTDIAANASAIGTLQGQMTTALSDISTNATAITGKQATLTTTDDATGNISVHSLTTQVGDHGSGTTAVDVRKANVQFSTTDLTAEPGASLVNMSGTALTLTLPSTLSAGDIITVYSNPGSTGPVKIIQGSGGPNMRLDGETGNVSNADTTGVLVGDATLAVITMVGNTLAIISGSDLT